MIEDTTTIPKFRVDKTVKPVKVFIQCSKCEEDVREMKPGESLSVNRAHYCKECDDGVIRLNLPNKD